MSPLFTLLTLAFIGSVAGLIGGVILLVKEKWAKVLTVHAIPLAAGVLLAVSLLDLFPEAVEAVGEKAFSIVLVVFVVLFLIERFLFSLHHHQEPEDAHTVIAVPTVILGDTLHNFMDGVAIAASFMIDPSLGLVVALATFLHETPHEIADFGILLSAGWTRQKAFFTNFASALATFPGAILTFYFAEKIEAGVGTLLAVSAGLFLYVAATDFLPELARNHAKSSLRQAVFLIIGILVIVALGAFVPEAQR
jgi:zinc and cadmium transporter